MLDKPRSGRPNERGDYAEDINTSVEEDPKQSIRRRSDEMNIPQTTLHRVLTKDLGYKSWKPTKVQFLSQVDHEDRVNFCRAILQKYDIPQRKRRLFFTDECAVYAEGKGQVRVSMWSKRNPLISGNKLNSIHQQLWYGPPCLLNILLVPFSWRAVLLLLIIFRC